jgi:O-antigen/teichoic acid export membrane protein
MITRTGGTTLARLRSSRGASVTLLATASVVQLSANAASAVIATIVLGAAERGVMVLGVTIGGVSALVGGLGTGSALRWALPSCAEPARRRRLISAYTWWTATGTVIAAGTAVVVSALSAPLIDPALSGGGFLTAVGAYAAGQVLMLQTSEAWFADGRYRRGGMSVAITTIGGLVALVLAATVSSSATVLLLVQSLGMAVAGSGQLRGLERRGLLTVGRPPAGAVGALVAKGAPALGLSLGLAVALRADRYILGAISGTATVGIYSLAATLSEIPRILPQAVGQLFVRDVALGLGRQRLARLVRLSTGAAAVCGGATAGLGWMLIVPVFGEEFTGARSLLLLLVVAETCFAPYAVASRGLLGGGWIRTAGAFGLAATAVAIACYLAGARLGGSAGLAVSCAILYGFLSAASLVLFCRRTARGRHRAGAG